MKHPIPAAAMKEAGAIIGRVGSGKTTVAKGIAEAVLRERGRLLVIDPTGVWWGLRSSADGKSPGFPVVVFGGEHADVPLAVESADALAQLLGSKNLPAIVDVSLFTIADRTRFLTNFLSELYRGNRASLTLMVDEADMVAPQRPMPDQTVMFSRMEQIVRRGRVRGFIPWLITQRPAELHKSVLSQANTLIAMQLTAPQDRAAVGAWIEGQADREEGKKVLADLPKLKRGEGWIWSPSHEVLIRAQFPRIATFDSSKTPEPGEAEAQVEVAEVDLSGITESLRVAVEEAAANDPKALRARIAELEREIRRRDDLPVDVGNAFLKEAEQRGFERGKAEGFDESMMRVRPFIAEVRTIRDTLEQAYRGLIDAAGDDEHRPEPTPFVRAPDPRDVRALRDVVIIDNRRSAPSTPEPALVRSVRHGGGGGAGGGAGSLSKVERAFLTALAQQRRALTRNQVAIFAGYSATSGHVDNTLSKLRTAGRIEGNSDAITITPSGLKALGSFQPLPRGRALRDYWIGQLDKAAGVFLLVICEAYPKTLTRDQVAERAGYSTTSGHVDNTLSQLRTRDLITGGRDAIRASEELFA